MVVGHFFEKTRVEENSSPCCLHVKLMLLLLKQKVGQLKKE